jgi:hypothetical protein
MKTQREKVSYLDKARTIQRSMDSGGCAYMTEKAHSFVPNVISRLASAGGRVSDKQFVFLDDLWSQFCSTDDPAAPAATRDEGRMRDDNDWAGGQHWTLVGDIVSFFAAR